MNPKWGIVYLVGAGPGDPGLITVRGREILQRADVVLHDRLIPHALLAHCRHDARLIDVGKAPGRVARRQEETCALLVTHARAGRTVVRLKGGDPFVFGRGSEELAYCRHAGVDCVVIPGVSSAIAVPAAAGVPLTHRHVARSFAVITGQSDGGPGLPGHDYAALARVDTLVLMMARSNLRELANELIACGRDPGTPAVSVASGTLPDQASTTGTLATIADRADEADLQSPVITVIGPTADFARAHATWQAVRRRTRPLAGRRVILTQAITATSELRGRLLEEGATIVDVPLIDLTYPDAHCDIDPHLREVRNYDWIVLTSVHGVRGFWKRVERAGLDARAIGRARIAVAGPGTARELATHGLRADLIPESHTGAGLVAALRARSDLRGKRVLFPHGSQALPTVAAGLRAAGAALHAGVVYATHEATVPAAVLPTLQHADDTIVFASPTAVRSYTGLSIGPPRGTVACIGPTTAAEAQRVGYAVHVVPQSPGTAGLLAALKRHFAQCEVAA